MTMDKEQIDKAIERRRVEESMRGEFEATVSVRVDRYLQVKPHGIVPYTYFASPLAQCSLLYRDGHFYGCIALAQAVAEALVKYICRKKRIRPGRSFEKNVDSLAAKAFISQDLKGILLKIWENRDDYHHLNLGIEADIAKLEQIALEKVSFLVGAISTVFDFTMIEGKLAPKYPEYWDTKGPLTQVFLNLER